MGQLVFAHGHARPCAGSRPDSQEGSHCCCCASASLPAGACCGWVHPQEEVFGTVSELVQSALDGYHVCLFSYGQTGAGKTHTMQGNGDGTGRGIIPRAVEKVWRPLRSTTPQAPGLRMLQQRSAVNLHLETFESGCGILPALQDRNLGGE